MQGVGSCRIMVGSYPLCMNQAYLLTCRRKRRWDQDDQGNSVDAKESEAQETKAVDSTSPEEPLAAAAEIAAKISASLADKVSHSEPVPAEPRKEEKTIFETLGMDADEKRAEKKISIDDTFTEILDINETRHRYYLNKAATQEPLEREFAVTIVSKGRYYPDRRLATEKEPPLRLEVFGPNEENVKATIAKLKDMMEKGPPETIPTLSYVHPLRMYFQLYRFRPGTNK